VATVGQWIQGARPRTLATGVSPVLVGTGAALGAGSVEPVVALLALAVGVATVVGVNYANDYSDGIRGTDDDRVGPLRLVGSRLAAPRAVRTAALAALGVATVAGLTLTALSQQWWLLPLAPVCAAGAWCYTGGPRPYGYAGFGEVAVFVFFGPLAVLATLVTQTRHPPTELPVAASLAVGALTCAVLVANNLRDIPTDMLTGKRTLAVRLGDRRTRLLYLTLVLGPLAFSALVGCVAPKLLLGLLAAPLAYVPARRVLSGATGRELIPVLAGTGLLLLGWSAATGVGFALP